MTKTKQMIINIEGTIYLADVSFQEGFVFIEDIKKQYDRQYVRTGKDTFWVKKVEYRWCEVEIDTTPFITSAEKVYWAKFEKDIKKIKPMTLTLEEIKELKEKYGDNISL